VSILYSKVQYYVALNTLMVIANLLTDAKYPQTKHNDAQEQHGRKRRKYTNWIN